MPLIEEKSRWKISLKKIIRSSGKNNSESKNCHDNKNRK